jgi:hypothetical protein
VCCTLSISGGTSRWWSLSISWSMWIILKKSDHTIWLQQEIDSHV